MSSQRDPLANNPVFAPLSAERRRWIYSTSERRRYDARQPVLRESEEATRVFCLLSGSVRVFHASADGGEVLLKILRPPAVFGEMEVIAGLCFLENVTALEPCEILTIHRPSFLELLATEVSVAYALLQDLSARFCIATHNEKALAFDTVRSRLASFLSSYVVFDGERAAEGETFRLPLTQDDMAAALAVTRRAVAKEISRWQKMGVVARRGGAYLITDVDALRREAIPLHLALTYRIGMRLGLEQ